MAITSFYYFAFLAGCAIVYYLLPGKMQWIEMLIFSVFFYLCTAESYTLIYIVISTLLAYGATYYMQYASASNLGGGGVTAFTVAAVIVNAIFWLVINGYGLLAATTGIIHRICPVLPVFQHLPLASALGMGYYTLQIIGYILDCYWETISPQKNFLKLFLFVCFFPQLTTGPISRYEKLGEELYVKHTFSYRNIAFGSQRILWGLLKVLVVSGRLAVIVNGVWDENSGRIGFYSWIAMLLYPLQLYLDFSGSMDVVLGSAEIFGIHLEENFNNPFFAGSVRDFWQRWHITLGTWAKDYVLYPVLHTALFKKISDICIKKLGKNRGKFVSTQLGMLVLWTFIGCWHGRVRYILGVTLWYWFLLFLGDLFLPITKKLNKMLGIKTESFGWKFYQAARTYFLFSIGAVSFRGTGIKEGLSFLRSLSSVFTESGFNPWIFFDDGIAELGLGWDNINIIIIAVIMLVAVGYLRQKHGYARIWIAEQSVGFRWMIWIFLILIVLIYGQYGPDFDPTEFIYEDF